jgi:DNA-binding beta-propeller fold protein YncE
MKQWAKLSTIKVGTEIHGIDLSPDGSKLFAADFGNDAIVEVDIVSGKRRSVDVAPGPYHVTALSDTRQLVVTSADEGLMWSIGAASFRIIATYRLEGVADQIPEVEGTR